MADASIEFSFIAKSKIRVSLMLGLTILLYLGLALPKITQPFTDDEIYEIQNVHRILTGQPIQLFVPPVYDLILAGISAVLGSETWVFRLPGMICAVLSIVMTFSLSRRLSSNHSTLASLAAAVLLAVNPAFVQGSLLVHIDNTMLVPAILLWLHYLVRYSQLGLNRDLLMAGVLFSLSLLIKFSTPALIAVATLLFFAKRDYRHLIAKYFAVMCGSFFAFTILWSILALFMKLSVLSPFYGAISRTEYYAQSLSSNFSLWIQNLCIMGVWFTPYLLCLFFFTLPKIFRRPVQKNDNIGMVSLSLFSISVYMLISTFNHGFPKYLMPGLPLLLIVCTYYGMQREYVVRTPQFVGTLLLWAALASLYFFALQFDPVFMLRYTLRQMLEQGRNISEMVMVVQQAVIVWAIPVLFFLLAWCLNLRLKRPLLLRVTPIMALFILSFSSSLALSFIQTQAPYQTNYSYGERGSIDLDTYIKQRLKADEHVLATKDVLYRLGRSDQYLGNNVWKEKDTFLKLLKKADTQFLVISIPSQSLGTYQIIRSLDVQEVLQDQYIVGEIGTYTIYERKRKKESQWCIAN